MKRVSLHIFFWIFCWIQDFLLELTWMAPYLKGVSEGHQLGLAMLTATAVLFPKFIVVYYALLAVAPSLGNGKVRWPLIVEMIVVFAFGILLYRLLSFYYIGPHIYPIVPRFALFDIRSILISILQIGFVTGIALMIRIARIRVAEKEQEKKLVREKLETELKYLRSQMKPHFLLNTLNNIYALARKKSDDTAEAVLILSELLQFVLYQSSNGFITLTEEVKLIEHYLHLEQMRYTQRLSISFVKEMDSGAYLISPLLLLPFIENAFKHGISETRFQSFMRIKLEAAEGVLHFEVENSKDNESVTPPKLNIGMVNVRRQLELTYKDFTLDVQDLDNIFRIDLTINLEDHVEI